MRTCPAEPSAGDRISASWMRELVRYIRSITPLAGPGIKLSAGPNGTTLSCVQAKASKVSASPDMGCWKIVSGTREEESENEGESETVEKPVRVFANQYYLDGEVLHELDLEDAVEDFVCQGELGEGEQYTADDKPFVALKVPATTNTTNQPALIGFKSLAELQTAQSDVAWVVKPLYKLTHDGSVAVDFRNCPARQITEILP